MVDVANQKKGHPLAQKKGSGSDLIEQLEESGSGMSIERTYEPGRDLITSVNNTFGTNSISTFSYINDAAGRRTRRTDTGSRAVTNDFSYNARSEVISALMGTKKGSGRLIRHFN